MPSYDNLDKLNTLYTNTVGRGIDQGGFDYWGPKIAEGTATLDQVQKSLMADTEYKDRLSAVSSNPNITEAELDNLASAFKGDYATMDSQHKQAAMASMALGDGVRAGTVPSFSDMFNADGTKKSTWKGENQWYIDKIAELNNAGGGDDGDDGDNGDNGGGGTGGLTFDDLDSWWDSKDHNQSSGNSMQDFMQFMMMMSMMGGFGGQGGGGYGGSQYGYGGLTPGGVMQATDPLAQLQDSWDWFQNSFGSSGATTNNINAGAVLSNPANKQ